MKILLLGSGGREHALAWKMAQSSILDELYIAPGNSGTMKLGKNLNVEEGSNAAKYCALSLLSQVKEACKGDLDRLVRVVKLTGFVNSTADFTEQPQVVNGASNILVEILGDMGKHSRSAVSAASLPLGVAVEIEGIFEIN